MTIKVTISNDGADAATGLLEVTVVTVGNPDVQERRVQLAPGATHQEQVAQGQFLMLEEKEH